MRNVNAVSQIDATALPLRLRTEGMEALTEVYKLYRNEFLGFAQRYFARTPKEILLHAWHDAMIAFYEICLAGKFDPDKSSLKTFLFTIGKHKLLKAVKQEAKQNFVSIEEKVILEDTREMIIELDTDDEQSIQLQQAMRQMGEKCRRLIELVYYHQYSSEAVQQEMDYSNPNVVYSHKSRCLKQLKGIMLEDSRS